MTDEAIALAALALLQANRHALDVDTNRVADTLWELFAARVAEPLPGTEVPRS